jgi:hypothetical protein
MKNSHLVHIQQKFFHGLGFNIEKCLKEQVLLEKADLAISLLAFAFVLSLGL